MANGSKVRIIKSWYKGNSCVNKEVLKSLFYIGVGPLNKPSKLMTEKVQTHGNILIVSRLFSLQGV